MRSGGWIKVHRKMFNSILQPSGRAFTQFEAWIWLLAEAGFEGDDRGMVNRSFRDLAKQWNWTIGKTLRFFKRLKAENMADHQTDHLETKIRITNYETYQGVEHDRGSHRKRKTDHQTDHIIRRSIKNKILTRSLDFSSNVVCPDSEAAPSESLKILKGAK